MLSFIFSNILIATNAFVAPISYTSHISVSDHYYEMKEHSQQIVATGEQIEATRDLGIYVPNFIWPVDHSDIGEGFGVPRPETNSVHMGIDIFPGEGSEIHAATDGTVIHVEHGESSYGYCVQIYDGYEYTTVYAHMIAGSFEQYGIYEGMQVKQGQVIGLVGSTGRSTAPHLHFEIWDNGKKIDPIPTMEKFAIH